MARRARKLRPPVVLHAVPLIAVGTTTEPKRVDAAPRGRAEPENEAYGMLTESLHGEQIKPSPAKPAGRTANHEFPSALAYCCTLFGPAQRHL